MAEFLIVAGLVALVVAGLTVGVTAGLVVLGFGLVGLGVWRHVREAG